MNQLVSLMNRSSTAESFVDLSNLFQDLTTAITSVAGNSFVTLRLALFENDSISIHPQHQHHDQQQQQYPQLHAQLITSVTSSAVMLNIETSQILRSTICDGNDVELSLKQITATCDTILDQFLLATSDVTALDSNANVNLNAYPLFFKVCENEGEQSAAHQASTTVLGGLLIAIQKSDANNVARQDFSMDLQTLVSFGRTILSNAIQVLWLKQRHTASWDFVKFINKFRSTDLNDLVLQMLSKACKMCNADAARILLVDDQDDLVIAESLGLVGNGIEVTGGNCDKKGDTSDTITGVTSTSTGVDSTATTPLPMHMSGKQEHAGAASNQFQSNWFSKELYLAKGGGRAFRSTIHAQQLSVESQLQVSKLLQHAIAQHLLYKHQHQQQQQQNDGNANLALEKYIISYPESASPAMKTLFASVFASLEQQQLQTPDIIASAQILILPIAGVAESSPIGFLILLKHAHRAENSLASLTQSSFTPKEIRLAITFLTICEGALRSAISYRCLRLAKRNSDFLLSVARSLLDNISDVDDLLRKIISEVRRVLNAERCSIFLVDQERSELVSKVFDVVEYPNPASALDIKASTDKVAPTEIRFPFSKGIAGYVFRTGKTTNITDVYASPLFNKEIDEITGFKTRSLLTIPIYSGKEVIGIIQAMNKKSQSGLMFGGGSATFGDSFFANSLNQVQADDGTVSNSNSINPMDNSESASKISNPPSILTCGKAFNSVDEQVANSFAVLCGLALRQSLMHNETVKAEHRSKVSLEILSYHLKVKDTEFSTYLGDYDTYNAEEKFTDFTSLSFPCRISVPLDDTIRCCIYMLNSLGIPTLWRTTKETIVKFLLTVQHGYRNVAYHNWQHAFSVAHFAYVLARKTKLCKIIGDAEVASILISCLCHDIDHRGTTNAFQKLAGSSLATLYSSMGSVMERHHFAYTIYILSNDDCNILANVNEQEYRKILDRIRRNILATDLAHHFTIQKRIDEGIEKAKGDLLNVPEETLSTDTKQELVSSLIMTASDLSDISKPWESSSQVAELIYEEFFRQGDLERSRGETPAEMFDRQRANKPKLQLGFIDHVALPVYRLLSRALPESKSAEEIVLHNRRLWQTLHDSNI